MMREVPLINNALYEGTQDSLARYFQGFCDAAKKRSEDENYSQGERKMARREAYCWGEAARVVRATNILPPPPLEKVKPRPKTIVPAPKEALNNGYRRAS